jgi:microsomal epoxide hydrolase
MLAAALAATVPWLAPHTITAVANPDPALPNSGRERHPTQPSDPHQNLVMKIQPFRINVDNRDIEDLRRRLRDTRWPQSVDGAGWAMGMDAAYLRSLTDYWRNEFDWRSVEVALNRVPHFQARSDAGSIHFVHLRGSGRYPIPIILTHGWPSTFAELLELGVMLANPSSNGATPSDGFDVVIPSLPGYAFSSAPSTLGTNVFTIADQWAALMATLGYSKFIAHGGDIGAGVSTALGLRHSDRMIALHLNYIPGSYQPDVSGSTTSTSEETEFFARRSAWVDQEGGYSHVQATKPDVLAPSLNDSPVGLAAWMVDKFRSWSDCEGDVERRFTRDEILTAVSIFWFTRSMPSAIRLYWEGNRRPLKFAPGERIHVPVGVAHFPREIPIPPRTYVERGYNVTRWTEMASGGHFAALEEPEALANDIRAFARQFRLTSG